MDGSKSDADAAAVALLVRARNQLWDYDIVEQDARAVVRDDLLRGARAALRAVKCERDRAARMARLIDALDEGAVHRRRARKFSR